MRKSIGIALLIMLILFYYTYESGQIISVTEPIILQETSSQILEPTTTYRVEYSISMQKNDGIGNDWEHYVLCNGEYIENGGTITAESNSIVVFECIITEIDKIPDTGHAIIEYDLKNSNVCSEQVVVQENRGQYAGNTAIWIFSCSVTQITAPSQHQH